MLPALDSQRAAVQSEEPSPGGGSSLVRRGPCSLLCSCLHSDWEACGHAAWAGALLHHLLTFSSSFCTLPLTFCTFLQPAHLDHCPPPPPPGVSGLQAFGDIMSPETVDAPWPNATLAMTIQAATATHSGNAGSISAWEVALQMLCSDSTTDAEWL